MNYCVTDFRRTPVRLQIRSLQFAPCRTAFFALFSGLAIKSIYPHKYWIFCGNIGESVVVNLLEVHNLGNDRISAVPITYFSSTSPSSQTGGCHYNLALSVIVVLSAVLLSTSTISNLIIISQFNHFTFVSALLLPVLRLNLMLPFRLQVLGTGGWPDLS